MNATFAIHMQNASRAEWIEIGVSTLSCVSNGIEIGSKLGTTHRFAARGKIGMGIRTTGFGQVSEQPERPTWGRKPTRKRMFTASFSRQMISVDRYVIIMVLATHVGCEAEPFPFIARRG